MPSIKVVYYKDDDGQVLVLDFLKKIPKRERIKMIARFERLEQLGHELRRPDADYLRDGIYELRMGHGHVNYRVLYFFHERTVAVLAAGITKEGAVPPIEIDRAVVRKAKFAKNPKKHTCDRIEGFNS